MANCAVNIENMNLSNCKGAYGMVTGIMLDQIERTITDTNALLQATWEGFIAGAEGSRLYIPFRKVVDATPIRGEDQFKTGNTGFEIKALDGKIGYEFIIPELTLCQAKKLKSFDGQIFYAYFITINEYILCSGSGTNNKGIRVQVYVSEYMTAESESEIGFVKVKINILPRTGYFTKAIAPLEQTNSWRPSDLDGIINVDLSVFLADASDSNVITDVTTQCDFTEVNDIVTAGDFVIENVATGATQSPSTLSASGNRYTLGGLTLVAATAYYIYLKSANVSTDKKYETQENGVTKKVQFTAVA